MKDEIQKLIEQIEQLFRDNKFQEIVDLLPDELLKEKNKANLYAWKGRAFNVLKRPDEAIQYAEIAISIDTSCAIAYFVRGTVLTDKGELDNAINDYNKTIELDSNFAAAYYNRGTARSNMSEHDKAIDDYNTAIRLDPKDISAYNNRGSDWYAKGEYDKAINDYSIAIKLNPTNAVLYYNRGNVWRDKREYEKAIEDWERFLLLSSEKNDYRTNKAKANIDEFKQRLKYSQEYQIKLDEVRKIVVQIKKLLVFEEDCITHYTSLTAAKILILNLNLEKDKKAKFRLSEGAFMNDPSEGKILYNFLDFKTSQENEGQTITDVFTEKPFLGSFVSQSKHDDLTLWRMYGKEAMQEAKGTALTLNRKELIDSIVKDIKDQDPTSALSLIDEFTFYKVAYIKKDGDNYIFTMPDADESIIPNLTRLMLELKEKIALINKDDDKIELAKVLNDIMYHFKSADYYYEHEVRLIISGNGFTKIIEPIEDKPKVSIELTSIVPALHKITLGPKVERAEEWAAVFHYHIKENYASNVEIIISHLPFK